MPGALLTQSEAARYLGKSCRKVREYTKAGVLPTWSDPDSGRIMYPKLALDEWQRQLADTAKRAS